MRTAHFCTTDSGGAYKAAERINAAMRLCGADSGLWVRTRYNKTTDCTEVIDTPAKKLVSRSKNALNLVLSQGEVVTDAFGTDITRLDIVKRSDVIILHWVNSFVSYQTVQKLAKLGKPVIWVMHDMWLYTGGCHSDFDCGGFATGCGNCPQAKKRSPKDLSYRNFRKKEQMMKDSGIVLVSPSSWNLSCAKKSAVCEGLEGYVINNPVDTEIFRPSEDIARLRKKLDIPEDSKVILFGAMGDSVHKWEGVNMLKKALTEAKKDIRDDIRLLIFGNGPDLDISDLPVKTRALGYIRKEENLAKLYSLSDVFVSASVADNYPNTLLESVCCGTPCVCFDIGGMGEIVKTGKTGYLAKAKDVPDMAEGIRYVINSRLKSELSDENKNEALKNNSYKSIGTKYTELCGKLLDRYS